MTSSRAETPTVSCRLCSGKAERAFSKLILERYDVEYFRCLQCSSVQTEVPYWLDEAYAIPGLHLDVGAPTRCIKNWLAAVSLFKILDIPNDAPCIDFGAGHGLFARLMRSSGYNFHAYDKFMAPSFTNYFSLSQLTNERPHVLTAFEVFEHLPEPRQTIDELWSKQPPLMLFTTWLNDGQPDDWIYYLPECGQHVFFYSEAGLSQLARSHGYTMRVCQYFYILYHDKLDAEAKSRIENFCINSIPLVGDGIRHLVSDVMMGNEHIDRDFSQAMRTFVEDLRKGK